MPSRWRRPPGWKWRWPATRACCGPAGPAPPWCWSGSTRAPRWLSLAAPAGGGVPVDRDRTAPEAYQWSVPLGAAVVVVPGNARWLSGAIADLSRRPSGSGQTICVAGGSGGSGPSTLAAGSRSWPRDPAAAPRWSISTQQAGWICWSEPNDWTGGGGLGSWLPGAIWSTSGTSCPAWTGSSCCRWAGGASGPSAGRGRTGGAGLADRQPRPDRGRRAAAPGERSGGAAVHGWSLATGGSR